MNVLAIGNSFSNDAMTYLHRIARADGVSMNTVGLYYPSCSLDRHYRYMLSGEKAYNMHYNGETTGFFISMQDGLLNREWDVVTIQQASLLSPDPDSQDPYAREIAAYVRKCAPKAKIIVHQTWAYEQGSVRLDSLGYRDHKDMFADIEKAYALLAERVAADGIIPCGKLFENMLDGGFDTVHRDTLHASRGAGRYALGLLWYRTLTGNSVQENGFADFDEPVSEDEARIIKNLVEQVKPIL